MSIAPAVKSFDWQVLSSVDYNTGHATTQAIDSSVSIAEAVAHKEIVAENSTRLSPEEISFFKHNGYLIKRRVIDDDQLFCRVIDYLWNNVPRNILQRDDPHTWLDSPHKRWTASDHEMVGLLHSGNWKMRSADRIGKESFLVDGIARHPTMLQLAEQLLGGPLKSVNRVRGVYAVLPKPQHLVGALGPHCDYAAGQLGAMVVADEMPTGAGGFTVWPGSHTRLHECWDTCYGSSITGEGVDAYRRCRDEILSDTVPVETFGHPGDVIFWHHRLLHSAGINRTADSSCPLVRIIVPCGYQRGDKSFFDDEEYGPSEKYQWWIDTRNYREDVAPTGSNLWAEWAI
ncbi:MAG: hypothetical protein GKR90_15380 [Pseudomonadales bacterium]|nr:hypothetical protein [Pseudomonadales bacterium]